MSHSRISIRRKLAVGLSAFATVIAVAGCGSDADPDSASGGGGGGSADASGVEAAKQAVAAVAELPTEIPITEPLSSTPPTGKNVFFVSPNSGEFQRWTGGFEEAAKELGWTPTILTFAANPADANGLVQQAIRQGADYIAVGGPAFPTNDPMVEAAKAADVPLFYYAADVEPQGEANWAFASVTAAQEYAAKGKLAAQQVIAAADGKPNALLFNVPQFAVFKTYAEAFTAEYEKTCPGCPLDVLDAPIADVLDGKASSAVIAHLRSHPEVNELACNTTSFCGDFPVKAKAAGITVGEGGVEVTAGSLADGQLPWVGDGTAVSGSATPLEYSGWQVIDAMARYSVGDSIEPNWEAPLPLYLHTAENSPSGTEPYQGPTDFQAQFLELWGV